MEKGFSVLVPERMMESAYERLYESINTGRLVGFVGSGLSLVYGNLTWQQFIDQMFDRLEHELEQRTDCDPAIHRLIRAEMEAVKCRTEDSTIVLEFVRQSFRALDAAVGKSDDQTFQGILSEMFDSDRSFVARALALRLELAGVKEFVEWEAKKKANKTRTSLLYQGAAQAPAELRDVTLDTGATTVADVLYRHAANIYDMRTLKALAGSAHVVPGLAALEETLRNEIERHERGSRLPTDRRGVLSLFLAGAVLTKKPIDLKSLVSSDEAGQPLVPARPLLDPLRSLYENLSIRRYFTTNYDFEIENLFMFADIRETLRDPLSDTQRQKLYQRPDFTRSLDGASITRHRPDGIRVRSDVNDGRHTAPLVEFGLGSTDSSIHIYHHHGRADLPRTLIAADGEYNNMYRAEGLNRQSLDRAYDAMIEGNPILFVGSGLNEEELNRTLRHRVSNQRSPHDTPIFVMRAADRTPKELMREQLTFAAKLDVQVIHFGHPRRGRGFSLRKHMVLLDQIAERMLTVIDPSTGSKSPALPNVPDKLRSIWNRQIDDKGSGEGDYVRQEWGVVHALVTEFAKLDQAAISERIAEEFGLVADLDFDRHVVAWLLGSNGVSLADTVRDGLVEGTEEALRAAKLIADYLRTLGSRLWTAALRHELRQIGREAKTFYNRRSRQLVSRVAGKFAAGTSDGVPLPSDWHRHVYIDIADAPDLEKAQGRRHQPALIRWDAKLMWPAGAVAGVTGNEEEFGTSRIWGVVGVKRKAGTLPQNDVPGREIIIGERGSGKGRFLKRYHRVLKRMHKREGAGQPSRRWLLVNCSYGQEADSVVTLITQFLEGDSAPAPGLSRRERIIAALATMNSNAGDVDRPLLVLGAVDRLFGLDHQPSGAEFDWLLRRLILGNANIDVVVTGSQISERYFLGLAKGLHEAQHPPGFELRIWRVAPKFPEDERQVERWLGEGYLRMLLEDNEEEDGGLSKADVDRAKIRMRHDWRRVEDIVGQSLDLLQREHPVIGIPGREKATGADSDADPIFPIGTLCQELLRVLAFVGLPIEGEVLLTAPAVRRELHRLVNGDESDCGGDQVPSASAILGGAFGAPPGRPHELFLKALTVLMQKRLVSLIEPHGSAGPNRCTDAKEAIAAGCRFALHRVVSQIIRGRFGVPINETVLSSSFNLSLYAAQPSDAPAFSPEITSDVEQLLDHMLNAWHDVTLQTKLAASIEDARDRLLSPEIYPANALVPDLLRRLGRYERNIRVLDPLVPRSLRAAGGLIRGFFSSVNLLGLDLENPESRTDGQSVISVHKQRIRTLLDRAIESQRARIDYWKASEKAAAQWNIKSGAQMLQHRLAGHFTVQVQVSIPNDESTSGRRRDVPRRRMVVVDRTPYLADQNGGKRDAYSSIGIDSLLGKHLAELSDGLAPDKCVPPNLVLRHGSKPLLHRLDRRLVDLTPSENGMLDALRADEVFRTFPFYEEEVVWLLNERAMLSLAQGDLYTASTAFELAFEANARIEGNRYHPRRCRLLLNRSLLWIERGKIVEARRCLSDLIHGLDEGDDSIGRSSREGRLIDAVATGYLGLCDQLNGFQDRADQGYQIALRELNNLSEQRAVAIFEYHRGSLLQTAVGQRDAAAACFHRAISAAEGGRHTDILYRVRIAQAHNDRIRKQIDAGSSRAILMRAIEYGERLDMPRVRVEALSASTQLRLELGDVEAAAYDCARALALASQFGMALRRVWLRAMCGKVYLARNDLPNARYMFEHAIGAAERIGFQRAIEDANRNLMLMPR